MRSLWDREHGPNRGQTPVASGGKFRGYQANHKYGVSNWSDVGKPTVTRNYSEKELETAKEQFIWRFRDQSTGITSMAALFGQVMPALDAWAEENTTRSVGQVIIRSPLVDIDHTGLRNIPGMMGPS